MGIQNQSRGFPRMGQFGGKPPETFPGQRRMGPKPGEMGMPAPQLGGGMGGGGMGQAPAPGMPQPDTRQTMGPGGMPISIGGNMYPGAPGMGGPIGQPSNPNARTMQPGGMPAPVPSGGVMPQGGQQNPNQYGGMSGSDIFAQLFRNQQR